MVYNIINKRNRTINPEKEEKKMLAMREEELNKVTGGIFWELSKIANKTGLYRPKFDMGEKVMSKNDPEFGVGQVTGIDYKDGYFYTVVFKYGQLYAPEEELEFAVTQ